MFLKKIFKHWLYQIDLKNNAINENRMFEIFFIHFI